MYYGIFDAGEVTEFGSRAVAVAWAVRRGDAYGRDCIVVEADNEVRALELAGLWDDGVLEADGRPIDALGDDATGAEVTP